MVVLPISAAPDGSLVISRPDGLSDDTWLQIRAEWAADDRDAARRLVVPLERFMSMRRAFAERCRQLGVGIELDELTRDLLRNANHRQAELREILEAGDLAEYSEQDVSVDGSRYDRELRPFQERDLRKLLHLSNGANFSVPGAGKTTVTLAIYEAERLKSRVEQLLVVAPLSAFGSWVDEVDESMVPAPEVDRYWGGAVPESVEILLTNYHRLTNNYEELARWVERRPTMVVLDEAHRMKKGWRGEWGSACLSLAYLAARRDILTGTPAPQAPSDLLALFDFLWPGEALHIIPPDCVVASPPPDAGHRVARSIKPLFARTSKADLDLPPVIKSADLVPTVGLQREIYDALRDQYRGVLGFNVRDRLAFADMGKVVMYLLEAAANPSLLAAGSTAGDPEIFRHPPLDVPPGSRLAELIREYPKYETPKKFIRLLELLRANHELGRKTLVWSNFVRNLQVLQAMLKAYEPALIHGAVPPASPDPSAATRESEIARFRSDDACTVLLANPAAMSEGISLHRECHDAIYLERTFNAGQYLQSIDRIHRLGLDPGQETRITFLIGQGTIDETVDQRIRVKAERLGQMLDDPDLAAVALPNEDDYGPVIDSEEDVEALFAHLRGQSGGN